MRTWAIGTAVSILLLSILLLIEYRLAHPKFPASVQRAECLTPAPRGETGNDRFVRLGGRTIRYPDAQWQDNSYTAPDIAQGRNLNKYDRLDLADGEHFHAWEMQRNPILAQARSFLWEHWRDRKRGYLTLTQSSVDQSSTSYVFVEPDDSGRWRVYRRQLNPHELIDEPTAYSVSWAIQNGWDKPGTPLPDSQLPDPLIHELAFHDVCGEEYGGL